MKLSIYIARQPIVDATGRIVAYELLYRDTDANEATVHDNLQATARVLVNALNYIGLRTLTKGKPAFVKIDAKILFDDLVYSIAPAQFVLELLSTIHIDEALIKRLSYLQSKGYRFALGGIDHDTLKAKSIPSLLEHIDYLKVNCHDQVSTTAHITALTERPIEIIAERIEQQVDFETAKSAGYTLFQGYLFAKPFMLKKERVDPASAEVLELIYLLKTNAPLEELVNHFNHSPYLTVNLLKYIQLQEQIADAVASIEQALILIGREQLSNWLELLMYAYAEEEFEEDTHARQLGQQARQRACLMQSVAKHLDSTAKHLEAAYMTGLLSVSEALFEERFESIISQMRIDKNIASALIKRNGDLGQLLALAIAVEQDNQHVIHSISSQLHLSQAALGACLIESYRCSATPQ